MNIASLFASLGIDVDAASFAAADAAIDRVRASAQRMVSGIETVAMGFNRVMTQFDPSKPAQDAIVSWDGWNGKQREAVDWNKKLNSSMATLQKTALYVGVAFYGFTRVAHLADTWNSARSRIRQLTDDTGEQVKIQEALYKSAVTTHSEFEPVVALYQQVGKAAKDLGRSTDDALLYVDTLNKAVKASGASADASRMALIQLSQGLGAGVLRGQDFRSVLEQTPAVIDIIAKSIGKTRGEMRGMAEAGALTSKVIFDALKKSGPEVDAAYAKRIPQISDAFVDMKNAASRAFGELAADKEVAKGITDLLAALGSTIQGAIAAFGVAVKFFAQHAALTKGILIVLAGALTAVAVQAVIAWAALFGPIALVGIALAALIAYWDDLVNGMVIGLKGIGAGVVWIGRQFADLGRGIVSVFRSVGGFFRDIGVGIRNAFRDAISWIEDRFHAIIDWFSSKIDWLSNKARQLYHALPFTGDYDPSAATATPSRVVGGATRVDARQYNIANQYDISSTGNPQDVAGAVVDTQKAQWDRQMRNAGAATEVP